MRIRPLLALSLLAAGLPACSGRGHSPTEPIGSDPVAELSESAESAHFVFHFSPGDSVEAQRMEAHYRWAVGILGVAPPVQIQYYKYLDRNQMSRLTGQVTNGWAEPEGFAVHSIWPFDPHEVVHVYSALVGRPSDFFNEGLAVAMGTDPLSGRLEALWNGRDVHQVARMMGSELIPLRDMVTTDDFRRYPDGTSYPEAGSFIRYLMENHGSAAVLSLFAAGSRNDSRGTIERSFRSAFGFELTEAEARWRAFLGLG